MGNQKRKQPNAQTHGVSPRRQFFLEKIGKNLKNCILP